MRITRSVLALLLAFCLLLAGCAHKGTTEPEGMPSQEKEPFTLPEGTQVLRQDVETLLVGAIGYDYKTGQTRITSLHILLKEKSGATEVLTLPRDTRAWIDYYENGQIVFGEFGSLSRVYAAGESAGKGVDNLKKAVSNLLGGVTIDDYVLLNAVQLDMLAEKTDGVFLNVKTSIPIFEINTGYQDITNKLQNFAAFSYLTDMSGEEYNGTDKEKLVRHQDLIQAVMEAMRKELEKSENPEESAQGMVECVTTNLTARDWLHWLTDEPGTVFTTFTILPGSHYEDESVSLWLYDAAELKDWVVGHFYGE